MRQDLTAKPQPPLRLLASLLVPAMLATQFGCQVHKVFDGVPIRPLTIFVEEDPSSLNTILNTPYGWQLAPLTQGYLFTVDELGRLVPDLAVAIPTRENGGISADGRSITYRLRRARWSDGAPFTAGDVTFTVGALQNPRTAVADRSAVRGVVTVAVRGSDRVVVRLRAPSASFVSSFLTLGASDPVAILPRHLAARYRDLNRTSLDTEPIGLGPFRLARWRRGERLEFEPNRYYWRGAPKLARLIVRVEPSSETRLLEMRSHDLDLSYLSGLEVDEARRLRLPLVLATTNIVDFVVFNLRRPRLRSMLLRRAIARAIDRERLARTVYRGLEVPTDAGQLDAQIARDARLPSFDPSAAAADVARSGDPGTGQRALDFAIAGRWRSSSSAALAIAQSLRTVGIATTLRSYGTSVFWGAASDGGILNAGRYDIALTSWSPSLDPDRSYLFGCSAAPPNGGNVGAYCSAAFDAAERRGDATYDPQGRTRAYRVAHARLAADLPVVPLGLERSAYAVSSRFVNFRPNPLGRDYWNAWEWDVNDR